MCLTQYFEVQSLARIYDLGGTIPHMAKKINRRAFTLAVICALLTCLTIGLVLGLVLTPGSKSIPHPNTAPPVAPFPSPLLVPPQPPPRPVDLPAAALWWPFDGTYGDVITGLNPSYTTNQAIFEDPQMTFVPGRIQGTRALYLNSSLVPTNDYGGTASTNWVQFDFPNSATTSVLNGTAGLSFAIWYYPLSCGHFERSNFVFLLYSNGTNFVTLDPGGLVQAYSSEASGFTGSVPCTKNQWQLVSMSLSNRQWSVYVNGTLSFRATSNVYVALSNFFLCRDYMAYGGGCALYAQDARMWTTSLDAAAHLAMWTNPYMPARPAPIASPPPPPPSPTPVAMVLFNKHGPENFDPAVRLTVTGEAEFVIGTGCANTHTNFGPQAAVSFYRAADGTVVCMVGSTTYQAVMGSNRRSILFANSTTGKFDMECSPNGTFSDFINGQVYTSYPSAYMDCQSIIFATWAMPDVTTAYTGTVLAYAQSEVGNATFGSGNAASNLDYSIGLYYYVVGGLISTNGGMHYEKVTEGGPAPAVFVDPIRGRWTFAALGNVYQDPRNLSSGWYVSLKGGFQARTTNITDNSAWRGWDGIDYTVAFLCPYTTNTLGLLIPGTNQSKLVATMYDYAHVTFNTVCQCFVALHWDQNFAYATSPDGTSWSRIISDLYKESFSDSLTPPWAFYPSLYDLDLDGIHAKSVSNFVISGATPYIYYSTLGVSGHTVQVARIPIRVDLV